MKTRTEIRLANTHDQKTCDGLVNHPLQSWSWGEFRKAMGIDVVRLTEEKNQKIVSALQLSFHHIPHTPWNIGYCPRGPVPNQTMLDKLVEIGAQKNAIFIQLEPNVLSNNVAMKQFSNVQLSHHPLFPKYTFILDLAKSEDELLKAMHPKTRYNIKVAQKHGVTIAEDTSPAAFDEYIRLVKETTKRQGFLAHNEAYHRTLWKILSKEGMARLWTAKYEGDTLAAWIIFCWNDTIYYPYGASSREHRETMAPTLLLWEITKWGKTRGFKKFDLWGALGPPPENGYDPNDPWLGFHKFKEGFRPDLVEFLGSYDLVLQPFLYRTFCIVDDIRKQILHIR